MRKLAIWSLYLFIGSIPFQMAAYELHAYVGSIPKLVGFGAAVVCFAAILFEGRVRSFSAAHWLCILLLGWNFISVFWSSQPAITQTRMFTFFQLIVQVLIIGQFLHDKKSQLNAQFAYLLGVCVVVGKMLSNFAAGYGLGGVSIHSMAAARYGAFSDDPNALALGLALAIPFAWYNFLNRKGWLRWIALSIIALTGSGIILTGSRGGALAGIAALAIIPFSFPWMKRKDRIGVLVAIPIFLLAATAIFPGYVVQRITRLADPFTERQQFAKTSLLNVDTRVRIWAAGLDAFREKPLLGVGAAAFAEGIEAIDGQRRSSHSIWIGTIVQTGIIGLGLLLGVLGSLLYSLRHMDTHERLLWIFMLLTWAIGSTFIQTMWHKMTWMLVGLLAARQASLIWMLKRERNEQLRALRGVASNSIQNAIST